MKKAARCAWLIPLFSLLLYTGYGQTPATELANLVASGVDPYFVESTDTVSLYGPDCITRAVIQDRRGHMWFATWQGIVEYDGKLFINHTLKDGLIRFHIVSVYEDSKGNKWFGTARGGLYRYDGRKFTLFTKKDGLPDSTVLCMAEDNAGNIWFGTEEGGASRFDGRRFRTLNVTSGLSSNHVNTIVTGKDGNLWFGTTNGVDSYNGKTVAHLTRNGNRIGNVLSLLQDRSGNLWIGTFDGLTRYDGHTFTDYLSPHLSYYLSHDARGNIWLAHAAPNTRNPGLPKQVLYMYNGSSFISIVEKDMPGDFQVFGNFTDANGNTWFGTMKGPYRYDGRKMTRFTR
ncbi:MAG: hypothetical protein KF744_04855 [Taibaiella sp.]|nr:hypothetical protein [Taibaiella sp.]